MARIGLLTFHFSENYGALMQAYGLRQWLRDQGHEAEFVNYHPAHVEEGGRLANPLRVAGLKANLKVAYLWLARLKGRLARDRRQHHEFARFMRERLGVDGPPLRDLAALDAHLSSPEGRFDMLVCGSDQIWSPSVQFGVDPAYFLSFPGKAQGARTVSYAPSFGRATIDPQHAAEVAECLNGLAAISVREPSGVAIVKQLTGRDAVCVPDPTILLGDFADLANAGSGEVAADAVFCYALRTGDGIRAAAQTASEHLAAPILSPRNPHRRWREIGRTIQPSPETWLAHVRTAAFVVTNSFHGTVFAVLFRKPFVTVRLPGRRAGLNERSQALLTALGLEDRMIDGHDRDRLVGLIRAPVDWASAEARLATMQASGRAFLADQLAQLR